MDRTVLVTGASSGIGEACARAFAAGGDRVAVCARRVERVARVAAELGAAGHAFALDVRDRAAVEAAIGGLPAEWREVDVLVNNAGLAAGLAPLQDGDPGDWERMLDTNVAGLLWVTRAVLPGMLARGRGHVINVGSVAGYEVYPGGAVYCASKAAVRALTEGLRMDVLGSGVRVSSVAPGLVDTEFSTVRFDGDTERAAAVYQGLTPLSAGDVADTVTWIAGRPAHVQVAEIVLLATAQAGATRVHRVLPQSH